MNDLYRLIYTSRNLLTGEQDEQAAAVGGILAISKRNNARVGVTGALLFNPGAFAQVLEGPRAAVETTFERIQRDPRHSDVSVLQCEPVSARGFPNWSMAFVGRSERGRERWSEIARRSDFDLRNMEADKLFTTLLTIVEQDEIESPEPTSPSRGLDVEALRGALQEQMPKCEMPSITVAPVAVAGASAEIEAEVLRAALDEERARTMALRRELDDARVGLAIAQAEVEAVRRLRDIWAERARAMAAVMCREPGAAQGRGNWDEWGHSTRIVEPALVKAVI